MKKLLSILIAAFILLTSVSCGNIQPNAETENQENKVAVQYPITVTDQAGRQIVIDEKPEKLVSGYYISTSALIALDLEDKMVGIEAKADKRAIYKLSAPELIDLPSVGTAKEFDLEGCAALEPDLVILPLKLKNAVETHGLNCIVALDEEPEHDGVNVKKTGCIGFCEMGPLVKIEPE